jgi:hypothetical protein
VDESELAGDDPDNGGGGRGMSPATTPRWSVRKDMSGRASTLHISLHSALSLSFVHRAAFLVICTLRTLHRACGVRSERKGTAAWMCVAN